MDYLPGWTRSLLPARRRGAVRVINRHTRAVSHNRHGSAALSRGPPGRGLPWPVGIAPVRDRQDRDDPRPVINGVQSPVSTAPDGQDFLERRV